MVRHRDVILSHMKKLRLRLNTEKSVLSPAQWTTVIGLTVQTGRHPVEVGAEAQGMETSHHGV